MGMLKEEPKLLYYYECIKVKDEDTSVDFTNLLGNVFSTTEKDLDEEFYKFICTWRGAFVGDMQEKLDKAMDCSNMERFAKSCGNRNREFKYAHVSSIKKDNWFKKLWKRIYNKLKPDLYLEKLLEHNSHSSFEECAGIEEYLNSKTKDEKLY